MTTMKVFDGTAWQTASLPAGTNATTFVGPEAPPGPLKIGDLWYDTDDVPAPVITLPVSIVNGGTGVSTAAAARTSLAMPGEELAYNQITANVTVTGTTEAGPTLVIEGTSRSYDGSPILIDCYLPSVYLSAATSIVFNLWDGSTDLGRLAGYIGGTGHMSHLNTRRRLSPTVGTHNYRLVGWIPTGTSASISVGSGAGAYNPGTVRVTRA